MKRFKNISLWVLLVFSVLLLITVGSFYRSELPVSELEADYFTPQSRYIQLSDAKLHIRQRGSGPHVLLIHGSFSSLHTWAAWEDSLAQKYNTVSVDLPGHGLTGPSLSQVYTLDQYANLMFELADSLKWDRFFVAGNSMGGGVSWKMALKDPERIRGMVLVDAVGDMRFTDENGKSVKPMIFKMIENKIIAKAFTRLSPRFFTKMNMDEVFYDTKKITPELVDRYYLLLRREGNRDATVKRINQTQTQDMSGLKNLKTPTLIIWGKEDRWIPLSTADRFLELMPHAQLEVFENAGHVPMEEIPAETVQPVMRFLQSVNQVDTQP